MNLWLWVCVVRSGPNWSRAIRVWQHMPKRTQLHRDPSCRGQNTHQQFNTHSSLSISFIFLFSYHWRHSITFAHVQQCTSHSCSAEYIYTFYFILLYDCVSSAHFKARILYLRFAPFAIISALWNLVSRVNFFFHFIPNPPPPSLLSRSLFLLRTFYVASRNLP